MPSIIETAGRPHNVQGDQNVQTVCKDLFRS
jgi:hypothetical protein